MTREELAEAMRWTDKERESFSARFPRLHRLPDGRRRHFYLDIGRGWIPLLARVFELAEPDERAILSKLTEKYGSLRIDFTTMGFNEELDRAVDDVDRESETICEACGAPARTAETSGGWIMTVCEDHLLDGARFLPPEVPQAPDET
jgi:hypothetical protein